MGLGIVDQADKNLQISIWFLIKSFLILELKVYFWS